MRIPRGILIFGANGSGKTTLGRELARRLNYKHMDVEDYYFPEAEIPYTISRTKDEVIRLMLAEIEKHSNFVLTGVTGDFGKEIISKYDLAVYLTAPLDIRLERIKQRAIRKYGRRVLEGGDMYENNNKFIDFAANRSLDMIDRFAESLTCLVLKLDSTKSVEQLIIEMGAFL